VKLEWDSKVLINHIVETMKKKQACILVGPSHSGKMHLVLEAYKTSEVEPAIFHTDLMT
jgi:ABC-type multidrug transport system fused ATPase/permease subunit